jgi:hypothetical protein
MIILLSSLAELRHRGKHPLKSATHLDSEIDYVRIADEVQHGTWIHHFQVNSAASVLAYDDVARQQQSN